jgi:hypothetical protein
LAIACHLGALGFVGNKGQKAEGIMTGGQSLLLTLFALLIIFLLKSANSEEK